MPTIAITTGFTRQPTALPTGCGLPEHEHDQVADHVKEYSYTVQTTGRSPVGQPGYIAGTHRTGAIQYARHHPSGANGVVPTGCPDRARGCRVRSTSRRS